MDGIEHNIGILRLYLGQYLGIENRKDNSPDGYVQGKEHKKECGKQNTCREGIVMNEGVQVVLLGMVMIVLAGGFCAFAIRLYFSGARKSMKKKGVLMTATVQATVTKYSSYANVDSYTFSNRDIQPCNPTVEYEFYIDGKKYSGEGPGVESTDKTVKVYYNPADPEMNCTYEQMELWNGKKANKSLIYVFIILGIIMFVLIVALLRNIMN